MIICSHLNMMVEFNLAAFIIFQRLLHPWHHKLQLRKQQHHKLQLRKQHHHKQQHHKFQIKKHLLFHYLQIRIMSSDLAQKVKNYLIWKNVLQAQKISFLHQNLKITSNYTQMDKQCQLAKRQSNLIQSKINII